MEVIRVIDGEITRVNGGVIKELAVVFDKEAGLLKYGEFNKVCEYYEEMLKAYSKIGFEGLGQSIMVIKLAEHKEGITKEEMCIFVNYMVRVSANSRKILNMLGMDIKELKGELKKLKELGF